MENEEDVAARWGALPPGVLLPLSDGKVYQLVFAGRPGSALGPDVRDAVLRSFSLKHEASTTSGQSHIGDVEFHIRSSDWFTHLHHRDARYNNVILHVVLLLDDSTPTQRQDGVIIPTCSLYDLPHTTNQVAIWPCQPAMHEMSDEERSQLLMRAGLLRFEQKTHTFVELLHQSHAQAPFDMYDACLIPALAEGLGYGRDRAFFRAAGRHLLGLTEKAPEPLGRTPDPPPLDAQRLRTLRQLVEQWRTCGAWQTLRTALCAHVMIDFNNIPDPCAHAMIDFNNIPQSCVGADLSCPSPVMNFPDQGRSCHAERSEASGCPSSETLRFAQGDNTFPMVVGKNHYRPSEQSSNKYVNLALAALRAVFTGLSIARTDILICNVVLPFAAAVALLEHDDILSAQAQQLYMLYPALSSNQVTRAMCKQLLLPEEPRSACQQQGLHYVYQQTCREKRCDICMMGRRML